MNTVKDATKKAALTGVLAALLIGVKWALAPIPNIEAVTILLATFAFVFGPFVSVIAAVVFVLEETLAWGFNTWAISYFIYWLLVAFVFSLLGFALKSRKPLFKVIVATAAAMALTAFFGVLTSMIDVGLFTGGVNFWQRFAIMYGRGIVFFALHIACNLVLFAACFNPLIVLLSKMKLKIFPVAESE